MTKYRVKTMALKAFEYGEALTEPDNDGWYYNSNGFMGINIDVIKRNPDWFEKIESEFRVGEYVISDNIDVLGRIVDVDELDNLHKWGVDPINGGIGNWEKGSDLRHAIDNEIEQALTEEANRRGFKGKCKYKYAGTCKHDFDESIGNWKYDPDSDELYHKSSPYCIIYRCGYWAEIIEDEWETEDTFIGKAVSNKETQQKIISFIGELSDRQAEAIAKALNKI